ncbi:hypothetical protein Y1Q_0010930 [Alligator mississippiensis]|uniref:Uncharacterized protein n=1 Tax=Alligator mississippiensis TaxID=8496 RepID=A0A151MEF4_ALLMI|nr:hypothetical protein Y1Q_0010930 [Alligator mississippiensis]
MNCRCGITIPCGCFKWEPAVTWKLGATPEDLKDPRVVPGRNGTVQGSFGTAPGTELKPPDLKCSKHISGQAHKLSEEASGRAVIICFA